MKSLTAKEILELEKNQNGSVLTPRQVRNWMIRNGYVAIPGSDQRRTNHYPEDAVQAFLTRDRSVGAGNQSHPHSDPKQFKKIVTSKRNRR